MRELRGVVCGALRLASSGPPERVFVFRGSGQSAFGFRRRNPAFFVKVRQRVYGRVGAGASEEPYVKCHRCPLPPSLPPSSPTPNNAGVIPPHTHIASRASGHKSDSPVVATCARALTNTQAKIFVKASRALSKSVRVKRCRAVPSDQCHLD